MSYIRAKLTDVEDGSVSRDGSVHLDLPDHDEAGDQMDVDMDLDDETLSAATRILALVDALQEDQALVIWKVIF